MRADRVMGMSSTLRFRELALPCALALGAAGCDGGAKTPALSRTEEVVRSAPIPGENAPKLGVVSELIRVREFTDPRAPSLGVLRAGTRVARSAEPVSRANCADGWYAIRPRGFVCVGVEATLDLNHPTLAAMALAPNMDAKLPYTYARARSETPLFERVAGREDAVREVGKLRRRAGMAVVGSWKAKEPSGAEARLALLTDGRFVRAADLEAARGSDFAGVELGKNAELPVAFVVKRGVRSFRLDGSEAEKRDLIEYHTQLRLSGRFRSVGSVKYWAFDGAALRASGGADELWVRHQDVTVVQKRVAFPDFVKDDARWLDLSVTTGTLVAYEGKRAVFVTLVSVARELPEISSDTQPVSDGPRPIPLGTFEVKQKDLTFFGFSGKDAGGFGEAFEVQDAPWALELSSGQLIHGAYWHDRFGIEHGAGSFELSPADAARIFRFVGPDLPSGWHAVAAAPGQGARVVIRK
jgi:hypothetical protein